ncbi:Lysine-specific demethylase JMJ25 [Bienertia sinuspersici]
MEGVLEEPLPPDDLRCKRTDGRDWRCKRRVVDGKTFCPNHLYRGQKHRISTLPKPEPETKLTNRVQIPVKVKPEPVDDDIGLSLQPDQSTGLEAVPDNSRCHRNDGRSWRCKKRALVGQTMCEVHIKKSKAQNQRKPTMRKKKKEVDERISESLAENLECGKNKGIDGRGKKRVFCDSRKVNFVLKGKEIVGGGVVVEETRGKDNVDGGVLVTETETETIGEECKREEGNVSCGSGDDVRCTKNDGRGWRCKRRVLEGQNLCEAHFKRVRIIKDMERNEGKSKGSRKKKGKSDNGSGGNKVVVKVEKEDEMVLEKENSKQGVAAAEDEARCKRTDGRGWRCKRRVMDGKTLCEIHYEQGRLRQMRITVPEELKIQRGEGGEKAQNRLKRKRDLEILESNSDKGMKRMKAELIRVFLRREIIESKKKSEKQSGTSEEVTRDLPYGLMAIPPAPSTQLLGNAGSLGIKIGANGSNNLVTRRFRSKNIEPTLINSLKVVPYAGNMRKVKSSGRKKCHWCRKCDNLCLVQCSSCRKRYFCSDCIKERSSDAEEVRVKCLVCRGSCDCKACCCDRSKEVGAKEVVKKKIMGSKFQLLQYLINFLLPILVQINEKQCVEVEMEAKFKGQNSSDVEIRQADVGCRDQCCCNNCKSPILDFHRSCPNCSYNLCLSCCREYTQAGFHGGTYPDTTKLFFPHQKKCLEKDLGSSAPLLESASCLHISCPPMELGGCDNSLLDLRCIFPLNWTKELEFSAKEMASEHDFLQNIDDALHCSFCDRISQACDKNKELLEASRRKESNDNFLYCPSTFDDHDCLLAHFQTHWRKGHPIKFRNVLQCASALSWDPLAMFCDYLENGYSSCKNLNDVTEAASCSGSFDVEVGTKDSFTSSVEEGFMHLRHETLKVKAKLSSDFSRKLLEGYNSEIIYALPLQQYINPRMGLLNIAGKLPEDFPDCKLGPNVCISYGSREEVARGELVTKLCYNSFDMVNILVHVGDATCSMEHLNKVKKLIKRNSNPKAKKDPAFNKGLEDEQTRLNSEISVEAVEQQRVAPAFCCSSATNDATSAIHKLTDNKLSFGKLAISSDTDSDASMICSRTSQSPDKSVDQISLLHHMRGCNATDQQPPQEHCGAQWDVFRRQDIPKLLEYITKHIDELKFSHGLSDNVVHPIYDGSFYLDVAHKIQLKEEFEVEPWTFNQCLGEAVFIPAGCPYQIRNIKVEKMTICSIDEAIKEIYRLKSEEVNR